MGEVLRRLWETWLRRRKCRAVGHRFDRYECDGLKRFCTRCGREEWVMGHPYPRIGQPAREWKHMDFGPQVEAANVEHFRTMKAKRGRGA